MFPSEKKKSKICLLSKTLVLVQTVALVFGVRDMGWSNLDGGYFVYWMWIYHNHAWKQVLSKWPLVLSVELWEVAWKCMGRYGKFIPVSTIMFLFISICYWGGKWGCRLHPNFYFCYQFTIIWSHHLLELSLCLWVSGLWQLQTFAIKICYIDLKSAVLGFSMLKNNNLGDIRSCNLVNPHIGLI